MRSKPQLQSCGLQATVVVPQSALQVSGSLQTFATTAPPQWPLQVTESGSVQIPLSVKGIVWNTPFTVPTHSVAGLAGCMARLPFTGGNPDDIRSHFPAEGEKT